MLTVLGNIDPEETMTELRFPNGRILRLSTAMLQAETKELSRPTEALSSDGALAIPLIEEQLQVSKRTVATGRVRLQKSVDAYDVQLDEPLAISTIQVERIALGHVVAVTPEVRQEGRTTVYPILEERLVLTKELVLVEEVRVTQEHSERRDYQTVTLRRERMDVERETVERS